jgi:hypothetical protein
MRIGTEQPAIDAGCLYAQGLISDRRLFVWIVCEMTQVALHAFCVIVRLVWIVDQRDRCAWT